MDYKEFDIGTWYIVIWLKKLGIGASYRGIGLERTLYGYAISLDCIGKKTWYKYVVLCDWIVKNLVKVRHIGLIDIKFLFDDCVYSLYICFMKKGLGHLCGFLVTGLLVHSLKWYIKIRKKYTVLRFIEKIRRDGVRVGLEYLQAYEIKYLLDL